MLALLMYLLITKSWPSKLNLDAFQSLLAPRENTAREKLAGFVLNDSTGVTIEVEGADQALDGFRGHCARKCHPWLRQLFDPADRRHRSAFINCSSCGCEKERRKHMCLGIPGQIVEVVDETFQIAKVDVSGVKRAVSIALVASEGVAAGDWVLIHVGFAMSKIDEREAQETMNMLKEMGEAYADELKMLHASQIE
jgi:hydrogenase expression/formation protein HypC